MNTEDIENVRRTMERLRNEALTAASEGVYIDCSHLVDYANHVLGIIIQLQYTSKQFKTKQIKLENVARNTVVMESMRNDGITGIETYDIFKQTVMMAQDSTKS